MKKTILIGSCIILIAALIIVLAVFAPRWSRKSEMRERMELLLAPDPQVVVLSDPLYDTEDPLHDGREAVLDAQRTAALFEKLRAVLDDGYRYKESEKIPGGAWDLSVVVRTAEGQSVQIFFRAEDFYYTKGAVAYRFTPKDADKYADFLQSVNIYFAPQ